jgi:branched-chain amino acid transport system substrate-binding protein
LAPVVEDKESKGDDVIGSAGRRRVGRNNASVLSASYNLASGTALPGVAADAYVVYMHADTLAAQNERKPRSLNMIHIQPRKRSSSVFVA